MSGHKEEVNLGNIYDEKHHMRRNEFVFRKSIGEKLEIKVGTFYLPRNTAVALNV